MSCYGLKPLGKDIVNIFKLCARLPKIAQPSTVNLDQDMHSAGSGQQHPAASAHNTWLSFCTEHKLHFLHRAAGQGSVCNVTKGANIHDGGVHDHVPSWWAPPFHMHLNLLVCALLALI